MIIIAAVDDEYGMMFNKRRVSKDIELQRKIMEILKNGKLYMNEYSGRQFKDGGIGTNEIVIDEKFLENAGQEDYCFVEDEDIIPYLKKIEKIVICKWNRKYPSDFKFPKEILEGFRLEKEEEFSGNSHKKITINIYRKE